LGSASFRCDSQHQGRGLCQGQEAGIFTVNVRGVRTTLNLPHGNNGIPFYRVGSKGSKNHFWKLENALLFQAKCGGDLFVCDYRVGHHLTEQKWRPLPLQQVSQTATAR